MRPTPIPDEDLAANPGSRRVVIAPPRGQDLEGPIAAVECLFDNDPNIGSSVYRFRLVLEDDDLEQLAAGQPIWISLAGRVVPWTVQVG